MPLASTSSSGVWNRAAPSASVCPSSPRRTPTTASWRISVAALLLLHPGWGVGADHCPRGQLLSIPRHLLAERPLFPGAGADQSRNRLSQERQRLPGGGQRGRPTGRRRPVKPPDHPPTTRLLDSDPGAEVFQERTQPDELLAFLCHCSSRVLPEFHFQASLSDP